MCHSRAAGRPVVGDTWCTWHMGQLAPLSQSFALATGHTRSTSTPCKPNTLDGAIVRMEKFHHSGQWRPRARRAGRGGMLRYHARKQTHTSPSMTAQLHHLAHTIVLKCRPRIRPHGTGRKPGLQHIALPTNRILDMTFPDVAQTWREMISINFRLEIQLFN